MELREYNLNLPPTFLLPIRLSTDELHDLEEKIGSALTHDISEAGLVLGKVATKQRAELELRRRKLKTEEVLNTKLEDVEINKQVSVPHPKRRRLENVNTSATVLVESDGKSDETPDRKGSKGTQKTDARTQSLNRSVSVTNLVRNPIQQDYPEKNRPMVTSGSNILGIETVKVVKLAWFEGSLESGRLLPLEEYLLYEGRILSPPKDISAEAAITEIPKRSRSIESILLRAAADVPTDRPNRFSQGKQFGYRRIRKETPITRPTHLLHQTTSEHEDVSKYPPMPEYLHTVYSCQRPTPLYPPNDPFICQLKKIKHIRELRGDDIGVRAYSSAISAIAAYPYMLNSSQEVIRLPSCGEKYGRLYEEWHESGHCEEASELDTDEQLQILNHFWNIWGVAATTARSFYSKGWKDLDDLIEYGWDSLSRVQQIGVKYYEQFQLKIPRGEVEEIGRIILEHAMKLHSGFRLCIVGGYRRGKPESGDVDVILSHPDEYVTSGIVKCIAEALGESGYITHTLTLSMANSERGQTPVSWKGNATARGTGFDTLDKALVVWQNPEWPTRDKDLAANPKAKNPNVHRRVDILVSPWKTFGCAVMGWTNGTTFNRDLRRYCRKVKGLKFDSSGIRRTEDGQWVDFESVGGKAPDYLTAEKRIFEGLELEWREPELRCTG